MKTLNLNNKQIQLIEKLGYNPDKLNFTDDEICELEDKINNHLAMHGISDDEPNDIGLICVGIMDIIAEL